MTLIRPIGSVLPVDLEGYLLNPCRSDLVVSPWANAVEEIKTAYLQHLGEAAIHSLYLRGSVAKGTAVNGISDIDTFAVVHREGTELEKSWRKSFQKQMREKYPFQAGIEMWCIPYQTLREETKAHSMRVLIKTQCICLYGENIAPQLPRYKPGKDLINHTPSLIENIEEVIALLPDYTDLPDIKDDCQWIMKQIVRTGFELVMEQENTYTRDLYPCYAAFIQYFPGQAEPMKQALEWAIAPTSNAQSLIPFLLDFKTWFSEKITISEPR